MEAEQLAARLKTLKSDVKIKEEEFNQNMKRIESNLKFAQDANQSMKNDYDLL